MNNKQAIHLHIIGLLVLLSLGLVACDSATTTSATPLSPPLADEIVIYSWEDSFASEIYTQFTEEYGVEIRLAGYASQEEAIENMRAGEVYDLVVMENQFIPDLIASGLLAELDREQIPNFKYIPASFRDLVYDPSNSHTIPYSWGTTGLLVRTDLVTDPVTKWIDMWDPRYAGQVINWKTSQRYVLGTTLMALGHSANSENPDELAEALDYLRLLEPHAIWFTDEVSIAPKLLDGDAVLGLGWSYDYWGASAETENIAYILPDEGTLLWGDNWIIPANSPNKYTAELFLNFFLRPEIAAQFVNADYYAIANESMIPYLDPELVNNEIIFPPNEDMVNAEFILPLSPTGLQLWDEIWNRFLTGQ